MIALWTRKIKEKQRCLASRLVLRPDDSVAKARWRGDNGVSDATFHSPPGPPNEAELTHMAYFRALITVVISGLIFIQGTIYGAEVANKTWPQAGGPSGQWIVKEGTAPVSWSVTQGRNVAWRTSLPEGGQSTVVVWNDRLFVTTNAPWPKDSEKKANGRDVVGYCLNAFNGKILWSVKLPGVRDMKYAGIFSDSTSPSPLTDGKHVWFFNASGYMGCWDLQGKAVWTRAWQPRQRHHSRLVRVRRGGIPRQLPQLPERERRLGSMGHASIRIPLSLPPLCSPHARPPLPRFRSPPQSPGRTLWQLDLATDYSPTHHPP